jgi:hypothetical protein
METEASATEAINNGEHMRMSISYATEMPPELLAAPSNLS